MNAASDIFASQPEGRRKRIFAFSLVEVVLALAIFAFAMVALVGLLSVGIDSNRESMATVEATNLVQSYFAMRRAAPLAPTIGNCPLPPLDVASEIPPAKPIYLKEDGTAIADPRLARFALSYRVTPPSSSTRCATVHVSLFWPPQVLYTEAQGSYETTASFLLK